MMKNQMGNVGKVTNLTISEAVKTEIYVLATEERKRTEQRTVCVFFETLTVV